MIILLLTACSSQAGTDSHHFSVQVEDGVAVARTVGGPRYSSELFVYELEMVLDTGQSEDALLYRPSQFLADEAGRMYINDTGLGCVLVFEADGCYSHRIGQQGFGPGEASFWDIQLIHEGVIQLYGIKERRTTRFTTDGTLLDITTLSFDIPLLGNDALIVLPGERRLVLDWGSSAEANKSAPEQSLQQWGAVLYGPAWDILAEVHTPPTRVVSMVPISMEGKSWYAEAPLGFGPQPQSLYHPEHGIVLSLSAESELHLYDLSGQPTYTILIDLEPEPVSESDRERARQILRAEADQVDQTAKVQVEMMAEALDFADHKAFWGRVEIDREGFIWLDRSLFPETETARSSNKNR